MFKAVDASEPKVSISILSTHVEVRRLYSNFTLVELYSLFPICQTSGLFEFFFPKRKILLIFASLGQYIRLKGKAGNKNKTLLILSHSMPFMLPFENILLNIHQSKRKKCKCQRHPLRIPFGSVVWCIHSLELIRTATILRYQPHWVNGTVSSKHA